jgi:hypothetical protein
MSPLENLIAEYLELQGFLVRTNQKVGRRAGGGWEMELDVVGYDPKSRTVVHYEPSIDGFSWAKREARYLKKFNAARNYIFTEIFPWLPPTTPLSHIAVFVSHPKGRTLGVGIRYNHRLTSPLA